MGRVEGERNLDERDLGGKAGERLGGRDDGDSSRAESRKDASATGQPRYWVLDDCSELLLTSRGGCAR